MNENELAVNGKGKVLIDGQTILRDDVDKAINEVLDELNKTNDNKAIDDVITSLVGIQKFSVFFTVKALYGYYVWWENTNQTERRGDTFIDYIVAKHEFNSPLVIERYISLYRHYETGELPDAIKDRPLSEQNAIVDVLEDGRYEIKEEHWEKLVDARNGAEVRRILRDIKGKPPTKGSYEMHLGRDGSIYMWHQGERIVWTRKVHLPNGNEEDDSIEQRGLRKALARAKKGIGLIVD